MSMCMKCTQKEIQQQHSASTMAIIAAAAAGQFQGHVMSCTTQAMCVSHHPRLRLLQVMCNTARPSVLSCVRLLTCILAKQHIAARQSRAGCAIPCAHPSHVLTQPTPGGQGLLTPC